MNIPILGLVENMSYVTCPDCGRQINIFGESKASKVAAKHGIETFARLPLVSEIASKCDEGAIEDVHQDELNPITDMLEKMM